MKKLSIPNLSLSPARDALAAVAADLREKRLWPLAVAMLLAIVAVPVVLSHSAAPAGSPAVGPLAAAGAPGGLAEPAISVVTGPQGLRLPGVGHDPFAQQAPAGTSAAASTGSASAATTLPGSGGATTAGAGRAAPTSSSSGSGTHGVVASAATAGSPQVSSPAPAPAPAPPIGLQPTQTYRVSLAMTNSSGGFNTIVPLERLSVLPSARTPLLVELGVLQGGRRVLFSVQPGASVTGPGNCIPGPFDCQILALALNQVESLGQRGASGSGHVLDLAVTGIAVVNHPSAAAALQIRNSVAGGGRLLSVGPNSALSLFPYDPAAGSLIDGRNLTVVTG